MKLQILALSVLLVFLGSAHAQNAFEFAITENGLLQIKKSVIPVAVQQILDLQISDISGETHTDIGKISYSLSEIHIRQFAIPYSAISIVPGSGIHVAITGLTGAMTLKWHYKDHGAIPVSDSGSADIEIKGGNMAVTIAIGASEGRPTAGVSSFSSSLADLDVKLHGGASWLYNLFVSLFADQIKKAVVSAMNSQLPSNLDEMAKKYLSSYPTTSRIDNITEVDYTISEAPTFTSTYLSAKTKGEFYYIWDPSECPSPYHVLPKEIDNEMLQCLIDEFMINSASYSYYMGNYLEYFIDNSMVPAGSPYHLNTTDFGIFLPKLYQLYPNDLMTLFVRAGDYPKLTIRNDTGIEVSGFAYINTSVILPSKESVPVFTLRVDIDGSGIANVNTTSSRVYGQISNLQVNTSLEWSGIGHFSVSALDSLLQVFVDKIGVTIANVKLAEGFPLPVVDGLTLIDPEISYMDGYLGISSDFNYNPPKKNGHKITITN